MFNFSEALNYLFKEKNWGVKFFIIYIAQALITVPAGILGLVQSGNTNYSKSLDYFSTVSKYDARMASTAAIIFLVYLAIVMIPYMIVNIWYNYEAMQAGIQNRSTKPIWKEGFGNILKKSGKSFLVSFIYGLVVAAVIIAVIIVIGIFAGAFVGLTAGSMTSSKGVLATSILGFGSLFILICCCLGVIMLAFSIIYYVFITPTLLRLVGSNTFNEAFKVSENWEIGKKYKSHFLTLFAIVLVTSFGFGVVSGIFEAFAQAMYAAKPVLGIGIEIIAQLVLTVVTTFFASYVYTRLLGQAYRNIVKKEPSLQHIKTEA